MTDDVWDRIRGRRLRSWMRGRHVRWQRLRAHARARRNRHRDRGNGLRPLVLWRRFPRAGVVTIRAKHAELCVPFELRICRREIVAMAIDANLGRPLERILVTPKAVGGLVRVLELPERMVEPRWIPLILGVTHSARVRLLAHVVWRGLKLRCVARAACARIVRRCVRTRAPNEQKKKPAH